MPRTDCCLIRKKTIKNKSTIYKFILRPLQVHPCSGRFVLHRFVTTRPGGYVLSAVAEYQGLCLVIIQKLVFICYCSFRKLMNGVGQFVHCYCLHRYINLHLGSLLYFHYILIQELSAHTLLHCRC